jgi:hypothetical protein
MPASAAVGRLRAKTLTVRQDVRSEQSRVHHGRTNLTCGVDVHRVDGRGACHLRCGTEEEMVQFFTGRRQDRQPREIAGPGRHQRGDIRPGSRRLVTVGHRSDNTNQMLHMGYPI